MAEPRFSAPPPFQQEPSFNFDAGPKKNPDPVTHDCDRCGARYASFGVGPPGPFPDPALIKHFCGSCWLLQPTTVAFINKQQRDALGD